MRNYYDTLGVSKDATDADIKKAFRKLAKDNHPDVNDGDAQRTAKFKEINAAYEVLGDPEKRRDYDNPTSQHHDFSGMWGDSNVFWDTVHQRVQPNSHVIIRLAVSVDEILKPITRTLKYQRRISCYTCNGKAGMGESTECPDCRGSGVKKIQQRMGGMTFIQQESCSRCNERGVIYSSTCQECQGFGLVMVDATKEMDLPVGCLGKKFEVPGMGNRERPDQPIGSLVVQVLLDSHPDFQFGNDYSCHKLVKVDPVFAIIGGEVQVMGLGGKELRYSIPARCPAGHQHVFPQEGIPMSETERGVFIAEVVYDLPNQLTNEQEQALRQYLETKK